jgi:hypothetical protein
LIQGSFAECEFSIEPKIYLTSILCSLISFVSQSVNESS